MCILFVYGVCSDLYFHVVFSFCTQLFVFYVVDFLFCFGLKDKYGIKCAHWRGGRDGKNFARDTP